MYTSTATSEACLILGLLGCIVVLAFVDGHPWHMQLLAWTRSSSYHSPEALTAFDDEMDGPEGVLLRQLSVTSDATAAGALHVALAKIHEGTGRPDDALRHFELARDTAAVAAKAAPPPSMAGKAIISAGKEREGLAEARLALARAYLRHGRATDADAEITQARNDEAFVGLEELHLTEIIREQGHAKRALGQFDIALHHYSFARSRVERSADGDSVAAEFVQSLLQDEASIADKVVGKASKAGSPFRQAPARRSDVVGNGLGRVDKMGPAKGASNVDKVAPATCAGRTCTATNSLLQKKSVVERAVHMPETDAETKSAQGAKSSAHSSLGAKVLALLAKGQVDRAEEMCLDVVRAEAHCDDCTLHYLLVANARLLLGKIYRDQDRLPDARRQFHGALEVAFSSGRADSYEADEAYEALLDLQSRLHTKGTPEAQVAAQAIFRDAQRAAHDAEVPASQARAAVERKLRANAKP